MVSTYIVLSLVTIFSSFMGTLGSKLDPIGSEETKTLDDFFAEFRIRTMTPTPSTPRPQTSACSSYSPLTDSWRNINYINRGKFPPHCDKTGSESSYVTYTNLAWGSWYRFTGAAGTKLPTAPAPVGGGPSWDNRICGTDAVAWIKGGNPTIQDGIVTRDVCFEKAWESCWRYKTTVQVAACRDIHGDYFVYQLQPAHDCFSAFCAID